jgi:hypothetical protein
VDTQGTSSGADVFTVRGDGAVTVAGSTIIAGIVTASSGLTVVSGGLSVTSGGLTVKAGGLSIVAGGLMVKEGGLSVRIPHSTQRPLLSVSFAVRAYDGLYAIVQIGGGVVIASAGTNSISTTALDVAALSVSVPNLYTGTTVALSSPATGAGYFFLKVLICFSLPLV